MWYNQEDDRKGLADKFKEGISAGVQHYFDTHEFMDVIDYFLDNDDSTLAEKAVSMAMKQHPNSLDIQIKRVDWLIESGMLNDAEEEINLILEIDNNNPDALELKGDVLIQMNRQQEGIHYLQRSLHYADDQIDIVSKIGVELMQIDELDAALKFFFLVLDHDIEDESALYNITYCYELLGRPVEAISFLQKYLDRNPYSQIAWHQLGVRYMDLDNWENAIWAFDYAILVDEDFLGAYFEKAKCYEELGDYKKALSIYQETLKMADPTAWTYYRIGGVYLKTGERKRALENYFKAIHEDPGYARAWYKIAVVYFENNELDKAIEYAEKSVDLEFDNTEHSVLLARLYMRKNRLQDAENIYDNLISFEVEDPQIWIEYSLLLKNMDELESSTEVLYRALLYFPENAEIMYRLTACLFSGQRDLEAIDVLREALKTDFDKKEILKLNNPDIFNSDIVQDMIFAQKHHGRFL